MKRTYGLVLARFQPIHNGHLELIKDAIKNHDEVLILIGSADKNNIRNPIPIEMRLNLVSEALKDIYGGDPHSKVRIFTASIEKPYIEIAKEKMDEYEEKGVKIVKIIPLNDLSDESHNDTDWGWYLHANVAKHINSPYFTMYYSDGFELIMSWFPSFIRNKFISFHLFAREATADNLSATKVRNYIEKNNLEQLKKSVPSCVYDNAKIIRHYIKTVKKMVKNNNEEV